MATDSTSPVNRAAHVVRVTRGVSARANKQVLNAIAGKAGATDDIRADAAGKRSRPKNL